MTWKETKNPKYAVCGASEFLSDEFVPQSIRDSYQEFIDSVDVAKVPVNDRGWKEFEWEGVDDQASKRYTVTWNDRFKFGAMRGPLFSKMKTQEKPKAETGQAKLDEVPADMTETNKLLTRNNELLETLIGIMGGPKPAGAA